MTNEKSKVLSVVVPVYFQEKGLLELYRRLSNVLSELNGIDFEIILVNDGSTDRSFEIIKRLCQEDNRVKAINFSRNFSQQIAITAGIEHAKGDAVVIIDDDLQDPPEVIPQMVDKWKEGYKVVYGVRKRRKGESLFKLVTAHLFYRCIASLSDVKLPVDSGDFRLIDRVVVDALKNMKEETRYLRGMISWVGFSQYGLPYERDSRFAGKTNYNIRSLISFAANGITSFSDKPLLLSGYLGFFITAISFIFLIVIVFLRVSQPESTVIGWTSTVAVIVFFGGIQLISLGIIGQYLGKIYKEIKGRPLYLVDEKIGFEED